MLLWSNSFGAGKFFTEASELPELVTEVHELRKVGKTQFWKLGWGSQVLDVTVVSRRDRLTFLRAAVEFGFL